MDNTTIINRLNEQKQLNPKLWSPSNESDSELPAKRVYLNNTQAIINGGQSYSAKIYWDRDTGFNCCGFNRTQTAMIEERLLNLINA